MKIKYLLFVAVAMLSRTVNEVSAQSKQSSRQVKELSSTEKKTRITPDLAFFNLHGPVKTLKDEDGKMWEFTPEGNLKSLPIGYYRDSEGYIVKKVIRIMDGEEIEGCNYIYNHKLQLIECRCGGLGWFDVSKYTYNQNGLVECLDYELGDHSFWEQSTEKYTYTKLDNYGNWIKRLWKAEIESGNDFEEGLVEKTTKTGVHNRTITYYK